MEQPDRPPSPASTPPKLEPWALGALLGAILLGWCPLTGLAAIVAGIVALTRIRRSGGKRTGAAAAWTGMILATLILLGWGWALDHLQSETKASMDAQSSAAVEETLRGAGEARARWSGPEAARPSEAALAAFAAQLTERMGNLQRIEITKTAAEGMLTPLISTAFIATYERGTGFGNAVFAVVPGTLPPELALKAIELRTDGLELHLPALPDGAPTTPEEPR